MHGVPPGDLPVNGFELVRVDFGFPLYFYAGADKGRRFRFGIYGQFWYRDADGVEHTFDAERDPWDKWTPMLALRYDVINTARVSEIRTIVIEFTSGRSLMVKNPGDGYTA